MTKPICKIFGRAFSQAMDDETLHARNINRDSGIEGSARVFVVFCKPILAISLQRKRQTIINASRVFVVFVF